MFSSSEQILIWLILLNYMWCNCELDDICIIDIIVYIVKWHNAFHMHWGSLEIR